METFNHQMYNMRCPLPSVEFRRPDPTQYQETISTSITVSELQIQLHCNTSNLKINPNNSTFVLSYTNVQSGLCLQTKPSFARKLVTVLRYCDIPQFFHQHIIQSIIAHTESILEDLQKEILESRVTPLPPFLFHVHVTCNKYYYPPENYSLEQSEESAQSDNGMVPASEESIKSLVMRQMGRIDEEHTPNSCPICLDEFLDVGCVLGCMPCQHIFHEQCIVNWLRKSHYCPICRFEMPTATTTTN